MLEACLNLLNMAFYDTRPNEKRNEDLITAIFLVEIIYQENQLLEIAVFIGFMIWNFIISITNRTYLEFISLKNSLFLQSIVIEMKKRMQNMKKTSIIFIFFL